MNNFLPLRNVSCQIKNCVLRAEQWPGNKETTGPTIVIRSSDG